jgi:hypothetical protein
MEAKSRFVDKESLLTVLLPFYGYSDDVCNLMTLLCKKTKNYYEDGQLNYHRILKKRILKLHYPKFERIMGALEKRNRWAQFRLDFQVKFPSDFPVLEQFLKDHPKVEFYHLHLVISEDSLSGANKLIDTMRDIGMLGLKCDESYSWLDSGNYCRAANMQEKLRFETEMIIGAEPTAFLDKVDEVGLLDCRAISRCPVDDIDFPVYAITVDSEFSTTFEAGERNVKESFSNSVKKCIFEEEAKKALEGLDKHVANLQKGFPGIEKVEFLMTGETLSPEQIQTLFSLPNLHRIEYDGLEDEEILRVEGNEIFFAVSDPTGTDMLKAKYLSVEFKKDAYSVEGEYIVINPASSNMKIESIERPETHPSSYSKVSELQHDSKRIVLHKSQLHHLELKSVPEQTPTIFPVEKLTLYINEKPSYEHLNAYLEQLPDRIPVTAKLDMAFLDDLEESKKVMTNVFAKNMAVLKIVMEMHDPDFIDHLYSLAQESKTLKEVVPIIHQDCSKTLELIKACKQVEQFRLDLRIPWEEQQNDFKDMLGEEKNNRYVIPDVPEWCIEYRYPTSFERLPIV